MYVVKRPFKNFGVIYTAGTVITEPAVIKRFKGKLAEGKIVEVTEQTYDATAEYFKQKYGVVIPPLVDITDAEKSSDETNDASSEATKEKVATVKPVIAKVM